MTILGRANRKFQRFWRKNQVKNMPLQYGLNQMEKRCEKITVSLTSFGPRLAELHLPIKTLLCQTVKPDRVVLFLDCDLKKEDIPSSLLDMQKYGLTIVFDVENLKPHKKYFYAMQDYSDDLIITVDDDVLYGKDMIKKLYTTYRKYPGCVTANRVHQILFGADGRILPYAKWNYQCTSLEGPRMDLVATGVGGVLYPPHRFSKSLLDLNAIKTLCLNADDLWLKCNEVKDRIPVVFTGDKKNTENRLLETSNVAALWADNVVMDQNDIQLRRILDYLGQDDSSFVV